MSLRRLLALVFATLVLVGGAVSSPAGGSSTRMASVDDDVRINQIQVIGSHNSYKRMVSDAEEELRRSFIGDAADQMQYQHEPLATQFSNQRVRQIELDVYLDSAGGLYSELWARQSGGFLGVEDAIEAAQ